jgi:DNA-binding transcriptional ArsR family regulator
MAGDNPQPKDMKNQTREKILGLSAETNIWKMSLRELGAHVGVNSASTVKYHLDRLQNDGLLKKPNYKDRLAELGKKLRENVSELVEIPVLGPMGIDDFLRVSPKILNTNSYNSLFAVEEDECYFIVKTENFSVNNHDLVLIISGNKPEIREYVKKGNLVYLIKNKCKPMIVDKYRDSVLSGVVIQKLKREL